MQCLAWLAFVIADAPRTFVIILCTEAQLLFREDSFWIASRPHESGIWPCRTCTRHCQDVFEWMLEQRYNRVLEGDLLLRALWKLCDRFFVVILYGVSKCGDQWRTVECWKFTNAEQNLDCWGRCPPDYISPRGGVRRWYSLLDKCCGCKPRVQ